MKNYRYKLTTVIINYNGKSYIDDCLDSILKSNSKNEEIIVVDNGSNDGSKEFLENKYGSLENFILLKLDKNYGPAFARNRGVEKSKGKYICFLDNDTCVDKNWAVHALEYFNKNSRVGIIQCKLLLANEPTKIDYVGEYIGQNGFLVQRGITGIKDFGQYDADEKILAAKSAGMFIRKKVFNAIGGFDDDYFIYVEETDLGWRANLIGSECRFLATSIVYHKFGTSTLILGTKETNYNGKYHGCKNYILTLFKNLETKNLFTIFPLHIFLWIGMSWYLLFKGQFNSFKYINQGIFYNIKNIESNFRKRKFMQGKRVISDKELFNDIMKKRPFIYYVKKATNSHQHGNAQSFNKISQSAQKEK